MASPGLHAQVMKHQPAPSPQHTNKQLPTLEREGLYPGGTFQQKAGTKPGKGQGKFKQSFLLFEDFSSGSRPANWLIFDKDGNTQRQNIAGGSSSVPPIDGWEVFDITSNKDTIQAMTSTSAYIPPGQADDWLITPPITIGSGKHVLNWVAKGWSNSAPDGYEVRVCPSCTQTIDSNTNLLSAFSTRLFNINDEVVSNWTPRSLDISAYSGQTVRFAFRNNSYDETILFIREVSVNKVVPIDAGITNMEIPDLTCSYTAAEPVGVEVKNYGATDLSNVNVEVVLNGSVVGSQVISQLDSGTTQNVDVSCNLTSGMPGQSLDIQARSVYAGDTVAVNDTSQTQKLVYVTSQNLSTSAYSMSWEPDESRRGWKVVDANDDDVTWRFFNLPTQLYEPNDSTAPAYGVIAGGSQTNQSADDYLFSTCFDMDSAKTYDLEFQYAKQSGFAESLIVVLATGPRVSDIVDTLYTNTSITNDLIWFDERIRFQTPDVDVYHIGFQCVTPGPANSYLFIDDVLVREIQNNDMAVSQVVEPVPAGFNCGEAMNTVQVRFTNTGLSDQTNVPVYATILGTTDTIRETISLDAGEDTLLSFTGTIDLSNPDDYLVQAVTELPGDEFLGNDTLVVSVPVDSAVSMPYSENFNYNFDLPEMGYYDANFGVFISGGVEKSKRATATLFNNLTLEDFDNDSASLYLPKIDNPTAKTYLKFKYRLMDSDNYPGAAYSPIFSGDSVFVEVSADCGPWQQEWVVNVNNYAANTSYEQVYIDLGAYASASKLSIRINAHVDQNNDVDYVLDVDDIVVEELEKVDAEITAKLKPNYSHIPYRQAQAGTFKVEAELTNNGVDDLTGSQAVLSSTAGIADTFNYAINLPQGSNLSFEFNNANFSATNKGTENFIVDYATDSTDDDPSDNSVGFDVVVSDTTYARDDNQATPPFFVGFDQDLSSGDARLGLTYESFAQDTASSVSAYIGTLSRPVTLRAQVFRFLQGSPSSTVHIESNDITLQPGDGNRWVNFQLIPQGFRTGVMLVGDKYLVSIAQVSGGNMNLGYTTANIQPEESYVTTTANPSFRPMYESAIGSLTPYIRLHTQPTQATSNKAFKVETLRMRLFPNPAQEWVQVELKGLDNERGQLQLMDITGRRILSQDVPSGSDFVQTQLTIANLDAGTYFVQWQAGDFSKTKRLVISR